MKLHCFSPVVLAMLSLAANAAMPETDALHGIASRLDSLHGFESEARFTVSMPQLAEDVVYELRLTEQPAPADPLGCNAYLIDWRMPAHEDAHGFSAYYDGNHFRYAGERLQEYHLNQDSIPFLPLAVGSRGPGVHRSVQFYSFLPQAIAAEMRKMASDTSYRVVCHSDTTVGGRKLTGVDAVMLSRGGVTALEAEYLFDPESGMPVRVRLENNPGSISEQSVWVDYLSPHPSTGAPIDERMLAERYPDAFSIYRESNYTIENLPGQRLPGFALPTPTAERYSRRAGDPLRKSAVLAILDASQGFTPQVVGELRKAVAVMPVDGQLIMAFVDNVADRVEEITGPLRLDETILMNSRALARDCGAASLPAILIVDKAGVVRNVIVGFNNELASDVIQKMTLMESQGGTTSRE